MKNNVKESHNPTATTDTVNRRFCVAPMMEWSDTHCRYFWRLLSKQALLYTEMVTTGALIHGDKARFLAYNPQEHPLALQLGGSNPHDLVACAEMAQEWGYDEVNLNCGCPSDRVQSGKIGACLMYEPELVRDCLGTMIEAVDIPVTIKHRIGVDDMEGYEALANFVDVVATSGCNTFIVHARKAWLKGLSPKENREVPPLDYASVARLKQDNPACEIIVNGGITSIEQCTELLKVTDGVMLGREVYSNPYLLAGIDQALFHESKPKPTREMIIADFLLYCTEQLEKGIKLNHITRHILGLYQGRPGARRFRRYISEHAHRPGAGISVIEDAVAQVIGTQSQ